MTRTAIAQRRRKQLSRFRWLIRYHGLQTNDSVEPGERLLHYYYGLALLHRLSCPLGRAVYLVNRHWNGDYKYMPSGWVGAAPNWENVAHDPLRWNSKGRVAALRRVRPDTAERWRAHWLSGGSLKKLS